MPPEAAADGDGGSFPDVNEDTFNDGPFSAKSIKVIALESNSAAFCAARTIIASLSLLAAR